MPTIQLLEVAGLDANAVRGLVPSFEPARYVYSYDPELGLPSLLCTPDRDNALELSARQAIELWQSSPSSLPLRPDGKPNRPLTIFTVVIE